MAVCNARYEFTLVDIGQAGRQSNGGVYKNSKLGYAIDQNLLSVPATSNDISFDGKYYPYVFVADDAFQMKEYMLKPYPVIHKRELIITFQEPAALLKNRLVFLQLDLEYFVDLLTNK